MSQPKTKTGHFTCYEKRTFSLATNSKKLRTAKSCEQQKAVNILWYRGAQKIGKARSFRGHNKAPVDPGPYAGS